MKEKIEQKNQMTEGKLGKQILIFFIPIMISAFFQHFYVMIDAAIVGKYLGSVELAAVGGSSSKVISLLINFFVGTSAGITAYVAKYYGAKEYNKVENSIYNGVILFGAFTAIISLLGFINSHWILTTMSTPTDTLSAAAVYLNTYFVGLIFCVFYNVLAGVLRALGDSKSPLYVLFFANGLNIALDFLLIMYFQMGVFGVALATLISQGLSAVVLAYILCKQFPRLRSHCTTSKKVMWDISAIGFPAGLQSLMIGVANILIQTCINGLGTDAVAAWVAYIKIDSIVEICASAAGATALTFVGQNYGAGRMDRVKESVHKTMFLGYAFVLTLTAIFVAFREFWLSMFLDDPEIIAIAADLMLVIIPMYALTLPNYVYAGALRGLGQTFIPMILTLVGLFSLRLAWVFIIFPMSPTIYTLGLCYPVGALLLSIIFAVYYYQEIHKY